MQQADKRKLEDAAGAAGAPAEASQGAAKRPAAPIMQLLRDLRGAPDQQVAALHELTALASQEEGSSEGAALGMGVFPKLKRGAEELPGIFFAAAKTGDVPPAVTDAVIQFLGAASAWFPDFFDELPAALPEQLVEFMVDSASLNEPLALVEAKSDVLLALLSSNACMAYSRVVALLKDTLVAKRNPAAADLVLHTLSRRLAELPAGYGAQVAYQILGKPLCQLMLDASAAMLLPPSKTRLLNKRALLDRLRTLRDALRFDEADGRWRDSRHMLNRQAGPRRGHEASGPAACLGAAQPAARAVKGGAAARRTPQPEDWPVLLARSLCGLKVW